MTTGKFQGQRAVIYARISRDKSGDGLGVQRQKDECQRYADQAGIEVIDTLVDNDTSAYSTRRRPGFERLKTMIREREIDALIYWKQDRLTRRNVEFWELVQLASPAGPGDRGVGFHSPGDGGEGFTDLRTPNGLLAAGFQALMAEQEVAVRSDRLKNWQRQKAKANESAGGARPFGWDVVDKKYVVNEREADALVQAAHDILAGKSLHSVANAWNDPNREGGPLRSTLGNAITVQSLKQMMLRTRNYGQSVTTITDRFEQIVTTNPPIMTKELFDSLERFLKDPARRKSKSNKARHLLGGIVQCHCGQLMRTGHARGRPDSQGERRKLTYYKCPAKGSGHVNKQLQYVDTVVELFVFRALVRDRIAHGEDPEVTQRISRLRQKRDELTTRKAEGGRLFAAGIIEGAPQLKAFNETIDKEIANINEELDSMEIPSHEDAPGEMAQILRDYKKNDAAFRKWRRMPLDERREWIRRRFHVVLRPHIKGTSRTFDTDTVSVYDRAPGEYGETLSPERLAELPLTPIADEGPPPSFQNLYAHDEGEEIDTWASYLNYFAMLSGFGWMDGLGIDPSVADSRVDWRGHWKEPEVR